MIDAREQVRKGLMWFGSATLLMRLIDVASILVLLKLLTREEMGLASLAWSVSVVLEAFSGLGVGAAIVQAKQVNREQLDGLFWYCVLTALLFVSVVVLVAPWLAEFYDEGPVLSPMIRVSSLKLIFVSAAVVPLQLLTRDLKFKHVGALQALATMLEATTKVTLALVGFGAWALVLSNTLRGAYLLLLLYLTAPFWPHLRFAFGKVKSLMWFGVRLAMSSIVYHSYRNLDYFLVGKFLGIEVLGVYRVAFDLAMQPIEAVLQVVNRVAYPVFSRIAADPTSLADAFMRMIRYLLMLNGPVVLFLFFCADELLELVSGTRWLAAAPAVQILCWAGLLRAIALLFPQLFNATGRPHLAIVDSVLSFVTLGVFFTLSLHFFGRQLGVLSICWAWVAAAPLLLFVLVWITRRLGLGRLSPHVRSLLPVVVGLACTGILMWTSSFLISRAGVVSPLWVVLCTLFFELLGYGLYLRLVLGVGFRTLLNDNA